MTLVIGVRCKDGVVIGADSIATYASADGRLTVEQEIDSKISIVDDNMIFASSGAVGLSQEVLDYVRGYWRKGKNRRYMSIRKGLADSISKPIKTHMERAIGAVPLLGDSIIGRAIVSSVIALPCESQQTLLKFDELANAEEYTPELPFVSIGSGQSLADPFLAFVKRVVWKNRQPDTVRQGIVGVLWTLEHVIRVNAGQGVGGQPSIATLEEANGAWKAGTLEKERLDLYLSAIRTAENALFEELQRFSEMSDPESIHLSLPRYE